MKMAISDRDKTLLCVVGCIVMIALAWYFGFSRLTRATEELQTEISSLQTKYNDLKAKAADEEWYIRKTEEDNAFFEEALKDYDAGFSQKATLIFTSEMEAELDLWIRTVSLTEAENIFTFGTITSSNPSSGGKRVYDTDMMGYKKSTTYAYECSYEEFKTMLAYILDYETRYTVDMVSCSYDAEEDVVSGTFMVSQYAVTGGGREYTEPEINTVPTGTENLFLSSTYNLGEDDGEGSAGNIINNYDLALTLSSQASDLSAVVLGRRGIVSSQRSVNENGTADVVIVVEGSDGLYTLSYAVDGEIYPSAEEGVSFNPGQSFDLIVYSSPRADENDRAGARVSIINNSDMTLNIRVLNDDENDPRFRLGDYTGSVNVSR